MARRCQGGLGVPGFEGIANVGQAGAGQLREVAQQHGLEVGCVDPAQALGRVDLVGEAVGVEAIRLQAPRRVQDEDLEHRFAEAEVDRAVAFAEGSDQQVELLHVGRVAAIHRLELFHILGLVGQVFEAADRVQPKLAAKLVVARHAAFAGANDVHRAHVEERVAGNRQFLQKAREVVQHQRAGVLVAEGIEQVGQRMLLRDAPRAGLAGGAQFHRLGCVGLVLAAQQQLLGQQRVQAVDLDELFGQAETAAVVVDRVAHHAAEFGVGDLDLVYCLAPLAFAQRTFHQPVPIGVHAGVQRRVGQDGGGPLDGVDLGHDGRVDEARHVEQARIVPLGVGGGELIADGVVLAHEQGVQQGQADPPVAPEARVFHALAIRWQGAVGIEAHLAARMAAQPVLRGLVAAIDLRAVPPVRDLVDGAAGGYLHAVAAGRVALAAADEHLGLPITPACFVVLGQGDVDGLLVVNLAVAHPVVGHELNPRRGEQVQEGHFLHDRLAVGPERAAEQLQADLARIRREQLLADLRANRLHRHIAQETRAGGAGLGVGQAVPAAVRGAEMRDARRRYLVGSLEADQAAGRITGTEVARVEPLAHVGEGHDGKELGAVVPVRPHGVAIAGPAAVDLRHQFNGGRSQRTQSLAHHFAEHAPHTQRRRRRRHSGQGTRRHEGRRQQGLAFEVVDIGQGHMDLRGGIGLRQHQHAAPNAGLRIFGRRFQRLGIGFGRQVVVLQLEMRQRQRCMRQGGRRQRRCGRLHLRGQEFDAVRKVTAQHGLGAGAGVGREHGGAQQRVGSGGRGGHGRHGAAGSFRLPNRPARGGARHWHHGEPSTARRK